MQPASHHVRRAFSTLLLIELWERFGYYGTAVLLVLFLVQNIGLDDRQVNLIWGAFSALILAAPAAGGWIGDKVLGAKRCMALGGLMLITGYLLLALSGRHLPIVFAALGAIIVGNALFKANSANLVRRVYEGIDTKIDGAFTFYYMTNNVAAMVVVLLSPWVKDHWGWHAAFAMCCAGMSVSLLLYTVLARALAGIGSLPDTRPIRWDHLAQVVGAVIAAVFLMAFMLKHSDIGSACVYLGAIVVLAVFGYMIAKGSPHERPGLIVALILLVEASLFYIFYQQQATSLMLFSLRNVDGRQTLFGEHLFDWSPAQYPAVNSIWVVLLSPCLAWIYRRLGQHDLPVGAKFAIGFASVAAGFFIFGLSASWAVDGKVSSWTMIFGYAFYSLGELLIAALGLAMISRYVPARMGGFMMGAFFVAAGVSEYLGSVVANFASVSDIADPKISLLVYTRLFDHLGVLAIVASVIGISLLPLLQRLSALHERSRLEPLDLGDSATATAN